MEQLPETAREAGKAELGEPSEPQPVSSKDKGKAPIREEEEAEDTERTVSSAPMGNGAPERILIIVVQRVKLTL